MNSPFINCRAHKDGKAVAIKKFPRFGEFPTAMVNGSLFQTKQFSSLEQQRYTKVVLVSTSFLNILKLKEGSLVSKRYKPFVTKL